MSVTYEAAAALGQLPVMSSVHVEVPLLGVRVERGTLVEYKLWMIEHTINYKRVHTAIFGPADARSTFRRVESFQLLIIAELFTQQYFFFELNSLFIDDLFFSSFIVEVGLGYSNSLRFA